MVRLVLFDIDGTLIRTGGAGVAAFGRTAELLYGMEGVTERISFHGRTDTAIVRELFATSGLEGGTLEARRFLDAYVFLLDRRMEQSPGETCPGVQEFIRALSALGAPPMLGLLTGNVRLGAEIKLRPHGLWEGWACGAFGDDHEDRDELARLARDRGSQMLGHRLRGSEILVIGDTALDVRCAAAIEARCLAVCTGGGRAEDLRLAGATWVAEDLTAADAAEVCR